VQLAGFGTFVVRLRPARDGLHPRTGARLRIPAGITPAFRPGAALRAALRPAQPPDETAGGRLAPPGGAV
jgi:DNA-binding protein HU-beta